MLRLAEDTKTLPETLAEQGDVKIPRKEINKLIGKSGRHVTLGKDLSRETPAMKTYI